MTAADLTIAKLEAYQILDSRGKPTVEVALTASNGRVLRAAVPSGASTGIHEALELRDKDPSHYHGQGVRKAIENVNAIIAPALISSKINIFDQGEVDQFLIKLDGTPNKSKLGANAILGVSMAVCLFNAMRTDIELYQHIKDMYGKDACLPLPFLNVINGGAHAGNLLPFQEFMIVPTGASTFAEAMRLGSEVYQTLKSLIKGKFGLNAVNVGDEGGFAPNINDPEGCLTLLVDAIKDAGHWGKISLALDVAASEFQCSDKAGYYNLDSKATDCSNPRILSGTELADYYISLCQKYPIISIEDPFDQDDWPSWTYLREQLPKSVQIVGDDLTVTNPTRIAEAIKVKACNALLLKINQIGTITESLQAAKLAQANEWSVMVSHRSGETEDTFIADLVIGIGCGQIKSGAPCRSERLAKYNRILRIENRGSLSLPKWL